VRAGILIVGQGLAGTLLAWEFERAGIPFAMVDAGHAAAASRVGAGIINPITGRRLVKSWRIDALRPMAAAAYRGLEAELGAPLWRERRVWRSFADDRERQVFAEKVARGELAPFAGAGDAEGFWIEQAASVDPVTLLAATRARWQASGQLREARVEWADVVGMHDLVIDCTGPVGGRFDFVPWETSKGEILTLEVDGLDPEVILNRGHWILPVGPGRAKVGATAEPGRTDAVPTDEGRARLEASAAAILGRPFRVVNHEAGVRITLPDRHPVAGRHPDNPHLGVCGGLGSKGSLWAPWLARQWVNHLTEGVPFDPAVDVARFSPRHSSQAWSTGK